MSAVADVIRFKAISLSPPLEGIVHAARFDGSPESAEAILKVLRKGAHAADVAIVPELDVLAVRWKPIADDLSGTQIHATMKRGDWIAFSEQSFKVYVTDDEDLEYWYERA